MVTSMFAPVPATAEKIEIKLDPMGSSRKDSHGYDLVVVKGEEVIVRMHTLPSKAADAMVKKGFTMTCRGYFNWTGVKF